MSEPASVEQIKRLNIEQAKTISSFMYRSINVHIDQNIDELTRVKYIQSLKGLNEALDNYSDVLRKLAMFHHQVEELYKSFPKEQKKSNDN